MSSYARMDLSNSLAKKPRFRTFLIVIFIGCFVAVVFVNRLVASDGIVPNLKGDQPIEKDPDKDDVILYSYGLEYEGSTPEEEPVKSLNRTPIIVYWNEYFSDEFKSFVPKEENSVKCPYKCIHTADRKMGDKADIRVFHERNFDPLNIPPNNPDALNIYYTLEPPYLTFSKYHRPQDVPPDYFNYTGSYRSRSYIYYPYDTFVRLDGTEGPEDRWTDKEVEDKLAGKKKAALIAMSNCGAESLRHEYVRKLRDHIEVTQVGGCDGTVQCEKDPDGKALRIDMDCMKNLNNEHFFYLSFENAVCPEYTSEKFWRMKQLIVPVVLSRAAMPLHVPNDTYIAASDFDSPKDLANFLKQLMQDKDEYRRYFNWAKLYRKSRITEEEIKVSCQLCKLAHKQPKHRIENYKKHWGGQECVRDYGAHLMNNSPNDLNGVRCAERQLFGIVKNTYRRRPLGQII